MKSGYKTTEFYVTVITNLIGILLLLGVFTPEQSDSLIDLAGALAMAFSSFGYNISRGLAKVSKGAGVALPLSGTSDWQADDKSL